MANMNHDTLMVIFVALTGFALLAQAIILFAFFLTIRKSAKTMQASIDDLKSTAMPILEISRTVIDHVAPKIESIAADLAELVKGLREQGVEIQASTNEILERVQRQTSRLDEMFTTVVDGVERAGTAVTETVSRPMRQLSAYAASAKAFLTVLATGRRPPSEARTVADQDMFV